MLAIFLHLKLPQIAIGVSRVVLFVVFLARARIYIEVQGWYFSPCAFKRCKAFANFLLALWQR